MPGGDQKQKQQQQQKQQKQQQGGGGKKGGAEVLDEQNELQAIVIADPFYNRFEATVPTASVLMPLASSQTPLIDNTLYMLKRAGVSDIFVACGPSCFDDVNKHVDSIRKWSYERIRAINCPKAQNVADLLREVYSRDVITSKIVIVTFGDVVSNMDLHKAIDAHIENTTKDKSCIMTIVFSKTGVHSANRSLEDMTMLGLKPDSNEILLYQWSSQVKSMKVPQSMMYNKRTACRNISIRADLCDPGLFICSTGVLDQLQDDFDFRNITPDLVKGLLDHCDTLGKKAYAYIEDDQYVACVRDLRTYMSVSRDYLSRWVYPLVPDANSMDTTSFSIGRNAVYREHDVVCDKNVSLIRNIALGKGTHVDRNVTISQSVIGRKCKIGANCSINGTIMWDDVVVGEDAEITDSLICNGAIIGKSVIIKPGCVIGNGVRVDDYVTIPPFTQIVLPKYQDVSDDDDYDDFSTKDDGAHAETDVSKPIVRLNDPSNEVGIVGANGDGVKLEPSDDNPVFNTLVPRDVQYENSLFLGEDKSDDDDGETGFATDQKRQESYEDSERKPTPSSFLDDEKDDTIGLVKPVAVKKGFLDDDDDEEGTTPTVKGFLDSDSEDEDEPKKKVKGFLDSDSEDDDDDDDGGPKRGFLDDSDDDEGLGVSEEEEDEVVASKIQIPSGLNAQNFSTDTKFQIEVADLVSSVIGETCTLEKFHMQVRLLRMPYNTTDDAVACAILRKLLKISMEPEGQTILEKKTSIQNIIEKWGESLVKKHISNDRVLLDYVYTLCRERDNPFKEPFFPIILHALFQADLLSEKVITDWEADQKKSPMTASNSYFVACAGFLNWLHDSDSEN